MKFFTTHRAEVIRVSDFVERYLLSAFYLWLAYRGIAGVVARFMSRPEAAAAQGWWLVAVIREVDVFAISLLIGLLLLRSRPPVEGPRQWREVLVPLAVSTFFIVYSLQPKLPLALQ